MMARHDGAPWPRMDLSASMTETAASPASQGSPFWRFSLAFYGDGDVARACLDLQERCDVDVNLLLFLMWLARDRRALSADAVRALDATLSGWRGEVIVPLRAMRRRLKTAVPLVDVEQVGVFRARVKALELDAERLQQDAMYALAGTLSADTVSSRDAAARANVTAYESVKGRAFDHDAVAILLAVLQRQ